MDLLADSGTSINIMSESIARDNHLPFDKTSPDAFDIKDAQGQQIAISGKIMLKLKVEGCPQFFYMEALLTRNWRTRGLS